MKRLVLGAVFLIVSGSAAMAQTADNASTAPVTTYATDTAAVLPRVEGASILFEEQKHDFGDIKPGDVVEHTFRFVNNGTLPLVIANVRTTCGCTATNYPKEPVMPGESASITARFNSAGKRGQQNKVITVESNAVQGSTQVMIVTNIKAAQ
ncbi:DUF1573 domain-containing protein [Rufibacter roseus]|uniref:DUF1573 domain-containing protein n=1 Tax=Rufibacter roseus TaxID=1567108 RepID=A0ABW2DPW1_9BACT|nr:DUF1573 domain-containing protein [Rufibacter roseus]